MPRAEANALSVRLELQADCLAGVWAAMPTAPARSSKRATSRRRCNAAAAIGDDRLQREAQGYVVPETFTHGTSEQRVRWFKRGFDGGRVEACDTFSTDRL